MSDSVWEKSTPLAGTGAGANDSYTVWRFDYSGECRSNGKHLRARISVTGYPLANDATRASWQVEVTLTFDGKVRLAAGRAGTKRKTKTPIGHLGDAQLWGIGEAQRLLAAYRKAHGLVTPGEASATLQRFIDQGLLSVAFRGIGGVSVEDVKSACVNGDSVQLNSESFQALLDKEQERLDKAGG
jgi:glycine cleavage system aminomethyltransferase T